MQQKITKNFTKILLWIWVVTFAIHFITRNDWIVVPVNSIAIILIIVFGTIYRKSRVKE